jgi:hypothetical protein
VGIEATHVSGTWWRHLPAGGDVLYVPPDPPNMRWQHGEVVEGLYLADSTETAWGEWYRWLAETGLPPMQALPRDLWQWDIAMPRVADLSTEGRLAELGLGLPKPGRADCRKCRNLPAHGPCPRRSASTSRRLLRSA